MPNASPIEVLSFSVAFAALCGLASSLWAAKRMGEGREVYVGQLSLIGVAAVFLVTAAISMTVPTTHSTLAAVANTLRIIGVLCVLVKAGIDTNSRIKGKSDD